MEYSPVQAVWEAASPEPAQAGPAVTPTEVGAASAFFTGCEKYRLAHPKDVLQACFGRW